MSLDLIEDLHISRFEGAKNEPDIGIKDFMSKI